MGIDTTLTPNASDLTLYNLPKELPELVSSWIKWRLFIRISHLWDLKALHVLNLVPFPATSKIQSMVVVIIVVTINLEIIILLFFQNFLFDFKISQLK